MNMYYETPRLILKVLHSNAADRVLDFYDRNKGNFEPWEPDRSELFYTLPFHTTNLSFEYNQIIKGQTMRLWIMKKNDPEKIIGCISFNNIMRGSFLSCVIGYKIDKDFCRQGFATEALEKTLSIIFKEYQLHRVEAYVSESNIASINLMEKLGFRYEGIAYSSVKLKGQWCDHLRYALIAPSI